MPAQERLSPVEQRLAYVVGAGIILVIIALFLYALGSATDDLAPSLVVIGLVVIVIGTGLWVYLMHPQQKFDDLKTPYYTGHEAPATPAEPAPAPPAAVPPTPPAAQASAPVPVDAGPRRKVKAEAAAPVAPVADTAVPVSAQQDDLTIIEGIGPKSAAALYAAGIKTFAQVAAMSPAELEGVVKAQKVRLVGGADTWPQQARLAASGNLSALEDYLKRIKRSGALFDDLTLIDGVGADAQQALYNAGIRTFDDLSQVTPEALTVILDSAGLKSLNPAKWPAQAEQAVKGNLGAFKKLKD